MLEKLHIAIAGLLLLASVAQGQPPTTAEQQMQETTKAIKEQVVILKELVEKQEDGYENAQLQRIKFPQPATKAALKNYIIAILSVESPADDKKRKKLQKLQLEMLRKIGPGHMDLLLAMPKEECGFGVHNLLYEVIADLAQEADRDAIIANLVEYPKLIKAVWRNGWTARAKPIMIPAIETACNDRHWDWITPLAELRDPSTYPALIKYMINRNSSSNSYEVFCKISNLPGIKIKPADIQTIRRINARAMHDFDNQRWTEAAARVGDVAALLEMVDNHDPHYKFNFIQLFYRYTPFRGTPEEIIKEVKANRDRLYWDAKVKQYCLRNIGPEGSHE